MIHRRRNDDGTVTAETAMGMCLLALLAVGLAWMVSLGVVSVRVHDAAREAARAVARGESLVNAEALARQVAPRGAVVQTTTEAGLVHVVVRVGVRPPGGLFGFIGSVTLTGQAVGAMEDPDG